MNLESISIKSLSSNIIHPINEAGIAPNKVASCEYFFSALNQLFLGYKTKSEDGQSRGDTAALADLLRKDLSPDEQIGLLSSAEMLALISLKPLVMDHMVLRKEEYDPGNIGAELRLLASETHASFERKFLEMKIIGFKGKARKDLLYSLACFLWMIRSNIKHGEKTPNGPDLEKARRDEQVCALVCPLLLEVFSLLFRNPEQRLVVYATLLPGEKNHGVISDLEGRWVDCQVDGLIEDHGGLKGYRWVLDEKVCNVKILECQKLPEAFSKIDRFEGTDYRRIWVPIRTQDGICIGNIYEWRGA